MPFHCSLYPSHDMDCYGFLRFPLFEVCLLFSLVLYMYVQKHGLHRAEWDGIGWCFGVYDDDGLSLAHGFVAVEAKGASRATCGA